MQTGTYQLDMTIMLASHDAFRRDVERVANVSTPTPGRQLFNSSLKGNTRRAIDIHEGEKVDEGALQSADPRGGRPQHSRRKDKNGASSRQRTETSVTPIRIDTSSLPAIENLPDLRGV